MVHSTRVLFPPPKKEPYMLTLEHVTKYYGRTLANDDISFRV